MTNQRTQNGKLPVSTASRPVSDTRQTNVASMYERHETRIFVANQLFVKARVRPSVSKPARRYAPRAAG